MNANDDARETNTRATQPAEVPDQELPTHPSWYWTRKVLAGNPFYLLSAALLLFGINRLSVDPDFLGAEEAKLAFNFSALQVYELLLVLVGIILARRRIWYDSTLLIGLENMLVLVPFILVTQALLIGRGVAAALCVAGSLMAVLRVAGLKRFIPGLNMPPRLLGCGLIFLGVNLALPIYFRFRLEDGAGDSSSAAGFSGWGARWIPLGLGPEPRSRIQPCALRGAGCRRLSCLAGISFKTASRWRLRGNRRGVGSRLFRFEPAVPPRGPGRSGLPALAQRALD